MSWFGKKRVVRWEDGGQNCISSTKSLQYFLNCKFSCRLGYIHFHRKTHIFILMLMNFPSPHSIKINFSSDVKLPFPALWHKCSDLPETTQENCSREIH